MCTHEACPSHGWVCWFIYSGIQTLRDCRRPPPGAARTPTPTLAVSPSHPMSDSYLYAAGTSPAHTGQGSGAPLRGSTSYQNGRSFRNATPPAHAHQILMASQSRRLRACGLGTRLWAVLISWSMHGSCPPTTASRKQSTTTTLVVVVRSSFWAQSSSSSPFTRFLGVLPGRAARPLRPAAAALAAPRCTPARDFLPRARRRRPTGHNLTARRPTSPR